MCYEEVEGSGGPPAHYWDVDDDDDNLMLAFLCEPMITVIHHVTWLFLVFVSSQGCESFDCKELLTLVVLAVKSPA